MGSGGDGYCDVCRSRQCECVEANGELFAAQHWAQFEVAKRWPVGSIVLCRRPVMEHAGNYVYFLYSVWDPSYFDDTVYCYFLYIGSRV